MSILILNISETRRVRKTFSKWIL